MKVGYAPHIPNYGIEHALTGRGEWTTAEYEHLRTCAHDLVRTHVRRDVGHTIFSTVDGKKLWALMGALDRQPRDRKH